MFDQAQQFAFTQNQLNQMPSEKFPFGQENKGTLLLNPFGQQPMYNHNSGIGNGQKFGF